MMMMMMMITLSGNWSSKLNMKTKWNMQVEHLIWWNFTLRNNFCELKKKKLYISKHWNFKAKKQIKFSFFMSHFIARLAEMTFLFFFFFFSRSFSFIKLLMEIFSNFLETLNLPNLYSNFNTYPIFVSWFSCVMII